MVITGLTVTAVFAFLLRAAMCVHRTPDSGFTVACADRQVQRAPAPWADLP